MAKTKQISRWFIFWWAVATLAGMLAAFVVLLPLLLSVDYVGGANPALYAGLAFAFAVAGALVALPQWLVLRRNSAVTSAWIGFTALGMAVVAALLLLFEYAPDTLDQGFIAALLIPLAVGSAQSFALRGKFEQPWLWVAVNYIAFAIFFGFFVYAERSALVSAAIYLSYPLATALGMWWLLSQQSAVAAVSKRPQRPATKRPAPKKR